MEHDPINPFFGICKELNIQFCLGYDPMEFAASLRLDRRGRDRRGPAHHRRGRTSTAWPAAFEALGNPDEHCKILVVP